ncbi:MAG TPA: hypothetical protein VKU00_23525 [Chthonomonadaceae bacterium]|nr:hypothetical protein [Chthonomonadaceae bacterium]
MATSTHTIEVTGISEETLHLLDERIRQQGGDRSEYIRHLLNKDLHSPTLSELLAPLRQQVAESGMSEEELDQLFLEAREEAYQERQGKQR